MPYAGPVMEQPLQLSLAAALYLLSILGAMVLSLHPFLLLAIPSIAFLEESTNLPFRILKAALALIRLSLHRVLR